MPARLRLCASSPICSIWPRIAVTSTGSPARTARWRSGPSTSFIQRRRVSTSGEYAPYRRTLPRPSFSVQWVRAPVAGSSSTNIHMLGVTTPAIGPTARRWWQGSSRTCSPPSSSATASSGVSTRPSSTAPPINAPRSGPDASSQVIGGPACRNSPLSSPIASWAGSTSTSTAWTASIRASACALASGRIGSSATVARSSSVPGSGGRQSTRETGAAWSSTAWASRSTPTLTTRSAMCSFAGVVIGNLPGSRARDGSRGRWTGGPRPRPRRARRPGGPAPAGRARCPRP